MRNKKTSIPVNRFADGQNRGISIGRMTIEEIRLFKEANQPHRHDSHTIMLMEKGSVSITIDFKKLKVKAPALIYMHPSQVHLVTAFKNVTVSSMALTNENLRPEYVQLLERITPARPLNLSGDTFAFFCDTVNLCSRCAERTGNKLYHQVLQDSCNAFVALVIAEFLKKEKPFEKLSRFEIITRAFIESLEHNYKIYKRPAAYAKELNVSIPYLNECVKNASGYNVTHHIQERVILEAKRHLSHGDATVQEIATELGYEDYSYFSRLFSKTVGMSALAFRKQNRD